MAETSSRNLVVLITHGADHELSSVAFTIACGGQWTHEDRHQVAHALATATTLAAGRTTARHEAWLAENPNPTYSPRAKEFLATEIGKKQRDRTQSFSASSAVSSVPSFFLGRLPL